MDEKQFERLQTAVQFAVDDHRMYEENDSAWGRQPYHWNQEIWGAGNATSEVRRIRGGTYSVICSTAGCLAGTIVTQHGDVMIANNVAPVGAHITADYCVDADNILHDISERATELLGVEYVGSLFEAYNGIDSLVEKATELAAEYGHELTVI